MAKIQTMTGGTPFAYFNRKLAERFGFKPGDEIEIEYDTNKITITKVEPK